MAGGRVGMVGSVALAMGLERERAGHTGYSQDTERDACWHSTCSVHFSFLSSLGPQSTGW